MDVPVVDLSRSEAEVAVVLRQACVEHGFFYVRHHGVPEEAIADQFAQSRSFFALPEDTKLQSKANKSSRGYTPLFEQTLDQSQAQKAPDTKESYYIWEPDVPEGSPDAEKPFHGPNLWPDPSLVPGFRPAAEAYLGHLKQLSMRLVRVIALALNLPPDYFQASFSAPLLMLRPIHYTADGSDPTSGIFSAGAHTDWVFITLLITDETPGLQIDYRGEWIDVPPVPGSFVVNIGDMLEVWSNGIFKSTRHRVINAVPGRERYSCAFFVAPNYDAQVECLPSCLAGGAKYAPTTCSEHLQKKFAASHAAFAEAHLRKEA